MNDVVFWVYRNSGLSGSKLHPGTMGKLDIRVIGHYLDVPETTE